MDIFEELDEILKNDNTVKLEKVEGVEMSLFRAANDNTVQKNVNDDMTFDLLTKDREINENTLFLRQWMRRTNYDPIKPDPEARREYQRMKLGLPCVTFGGSFNNTRGLGTLDTYSGRIVIDIDHVTDKQIANYKVDILKWDDVIFVFRSVGGKGLKIVHKLNWQGEDPVLFHRSAFNLLKKRYSGINAIIDESGKDIPRLCYLCNDDNTYYNKKAKHMAVTLEEKEVRAVQKEAQFAHFYDHVELRERNTQDAVDLLMDIVTFLHTSGNFIFSEYEYWYKLAFAIKNSISDGPPGFEIFHTISQLDNENYGGIEIVRDKWAQCMVDPKRHKITLGSVIHWATEFGYEVKRNKMPNQLFLDYLLTNLKNDEVYIRRNVFSDSLEIFDNNKWRYFEDNDLIHIRIMTFNNKLAKMDAGDFLREIAPDYNPLREFMNEIPDWDGKDWIKELYNTITLYDKEDYDIGLKYLRMWLIGTLAGFEEDGYNENILVLIGDQGVGKTRWTNKLLPDKYKRFFAEKNIDPKSPDDMRLASENFIVFMDEMANVINNKASIEDLKNFTSQRTFRIRIPYAREMSTLKKVCSFIGSSNDDTILSDLSGNRRFLMIKVKTIDKEHTLDMMKVWAHIKHLYKDKEKYWLDINEIQIQKEYNTKFEKISSYEDLISMYIGHGKNTTHYYNATEVMEHLRNITLI